MIALALLACGAPEAPVQTVRSLAQPADLEAQCRDEVGEPRVEEVSPGVFVARGYDLANTIVIQTEAGRVVIDAGMSPTRARPVREALDAVSTGPILALIYTHSHIDHVGGASVWVEADTEVWATEAFESHFFKQYGLFLGVEAARGVRQFGTDIPESALACSAIGRPVDLRAGLESGAVLPTHTFTIETELVFGGRTIQLVEAHGETDDQLFVWLPEQQILLPGDNLYAAFPNLYTIRGTRPRPTGTWIASLDAMRARDPELLIPSHTNPIRGRQEVRRRLTVYRDGIQWIRDAVVRGANEGWSADELADRVGLPEHLASEPSLSELYGQIDWSVRAIYGNELGWFGGRAAELYPLPEEDRATRLIAAMGGPAAVLQAAGSATDARWALELYGLLEQSGERSLDVPIAAAYEELAEGTSNTNGRAYLLRAAAERRAGHVPSVGKPTLTEDFVAKLPIEHLLGSMAPRLRPGAAMEVHECIVLDFEDHEAAVLTVRRGVLELVWGAPLPGTPAPVATATLSTQTWKELALQRRSAAGALADGSLAIAGSPVAFKAFMDRFTQGLMKPPTRLP